MSERSCPECLLPDDGDCACLDETLQRLRREEEQSVTYGRIPGPQIHVATDTAAAQFYEGVIELCVYEDDQEQYVPRKDGRCFRMTRAAAKRLRDDLGKAIAELDAGYAPRQESLL